MHSFGGSLWCAGLPASCTLERCPSGSGRLRLAGLCKNGGDLETGAQGRAQGRWLVAQGSVRMHTDPWETSSPGTGLWPDHPSLVCGCTGGGGPRG